jgi:hypothetical protein
MTLKAGSVRTGVTLLMGASLLLGVASAQQLTPDQEKRINIGVTLIKLGCGTGSSREHTEISGTADVSLTLRKPPGISAGGQVAYSIEEAQGLVASLQKVLTDEAAQLSAAQLDCMRPYIQKIFAMVFPDQKPAQTSGDGRPDAPVSIRLVSSATQPLDGYEFKGTPTLPPGLEAGPLLPGGGRTRVVLQSSSPDRVVQIDRIAVQVKRRELTPDLAFNYTVDPVRQSGFGVARPKQFIVKLKDSDQAETNWLTDKNEAVSVPLSNILPKRAFPILELDSHSGLQEAFDFNLVPANQGFYEVRFVAYATSMGNEYELSTTPIYIVRH